MDLIAKAVTLKSIKIKDLTAKELLFSAKHSVLYSFSSVTSSWEKTETEGCFSIYRRNKTAGSDPVLFILNRSNPENFSCPITEIESIQFEGDLLMVLLNNTQVMGIWLFDVQERQLAFEVLDDLLKSKVLDHSDGEELNHQTQINTVQQLKPISVNDLLNPSGTSKPAEKPASILDLLSKARVKETPALSLDDAILEHFSSDYNFNSNYNISVPASLKSFTESVCQLLQSNPHLLAPLHRQLALHSDEEDNNPNKQ